MSLHIAPWTLLALAISFSGCVGSPDRAKGPPMGDEVSHASLPCSFAGFSSEEGFSCKRQDTVQDLQLDMAHRSPEGSAMDPPGPIHLTIHTTSADAREKCDELSAYASPHTDTRWTLEIESSDPTDHACTLRLPRLSDVPVPFWPIIEKILLVAIGTSPGDADKFLQLMIMVVEEMRAHLAETDKA